MIVLSSNDGCVVARSKEVKELGIPMGAPAFNTTRFFGNIMLKFYPQTLHYMAICPIE